MSLWRQLRRGLRALGNRAAVDRDDAEEVGHFLEESAAALRERGMSDADAVRAARVEVGSVTSLRQELREFGWEHWVDTVVSDCRYAARGLVADPGFTAVAVLTLALGIGAVTAIFSAVNPILFRALPYPYPSRVVTIWDEGSDGSRIQLTFGTERELAARSRSFEKIALWNTWQPTLRSELEPARLDGQRVGADYFATLGVTPILGRAFQEGDDRPGGPNVVILSDPLWRRRFDGDRAIIGRTIALDDIPFTVIGVMPTAFENVLLPSAGVWAPLQYDLSQGRAWGHHLRAIGRLRPGIAPAVADRELDAIAAAPEAEFPRPAWASLGNGLEVTTLQADLTRGVRPALVAMMGAVVLVLAMAWVNVTNLLLARAVRRRGEFALRAALGAGSSRLVRQSLTEGLLLAAIGGMVGVAVAVIGVRAVVALSPADLPRAAAIRLDGGVLAFAVAVTTAIGLLLGLVPALRAKHDGSNGPLPIGSRRAVGGHGRARTVLVIAEVSLAFVVLVGSGLLLRSIHRLLAVATGLDAEKVLTLQVQLSPQRYRDPEASWRFYAEALEAVRLVPGVTAAAATSQLPLSGDIDLYGVRFDPSVTDDPGEVRGTFRYAVSPGYLEAMGIPLRRGRLLDQHDDAGAPPVALVSESVAARRLPGLDPIGRRLQIGAGRLYTIVGVVGDVRQLSLAAPESDAVYVTASQWRFADNVMTVVVRTSGDPAALADPVRRAIWSVDKDQPITRVVTMERLVAGSAAERRFALVLFEAFGLVALVLAAAGIYGVLAGAVAERTREIGVRAALGASRGDVLAMVVRQGVALTAIGTGLGLLGAVGATRALTSMLFEVSRHDPVTYVGVGAVLAIVSLVASVVPAWRATRVDPATPLRAE